MDFSGPHIGIRHDMRLLAESNLNSRIAPFHPQFVVYGDSAYYHCPYILAGYPGANLSEQQAQFNKKMSTTKVNVEWAFGNLLNLWNGLRLTKSFHFWLSPVGLYYRVAVFFV